jgi:hypothetical protein
MEKYDLERIQAKLIPIIPSYKFPRPFQGPKDTSSRFRLPSRLWALAKNSETFVT